MADDKCEGANLYEVLGIPSTASSGDIKAAFKRLALLHHPDRQGDTNIFKAVAAAYETLVDARKRKLYDIELKERQAETLHLHPTSQVLKPFVAACTDGPKRTFDIDGRSFGMALRHGDMVSLSSGSMGVVIGVFDETIWWWKNMNEKAEPLGTRESLTAPGFDSVSWRRIGNVTGIFDPKKAQMQLEKKYYDEREKRLRMENEKKMKQEVKKRIKKVQDKLRVLPMQEYLSRGQIQWTRDIELAESGKRFSFELRVLTYFAEVSQVGKDMAKEALAMGASMGDGRQSTSNNMKPPPFPQAFQHETSASPAVPQRGRSASKKQKSRTKGTVLQQRSHSMTFSDAASVTSGMSRSRTPTNKVRTSSLRSTASRARSSSIGRPRVCTRRPIDASKY
eukprot:Sspe_Gene.16970::Locus_6008_Transcript_1_1_Confidence_1.000_Length_1462::g.16970::m.16970